MGSFCERKKEEKKTRYTFWLQTFKSCLLKSGMAGTNLNLK